MYVYRKVTVRIYWVLASSTTLAWCMLDTVDAHQPESSGRAKEMPQLSRSKGGGKQNLEDSRV